MISGRKFSFKITAEQSRKPPFPTVYTTIYLPKYGYPHSDSVVLIHLWVNHSNALLHLLMVKIFVSSQIGEL